MAAAWACWRRRSSLTLRLDGVVRHGYAHRLEQSLYEFIVAARLVEKLSETLLSESLLGILEQAQAFPRKFIEKLGRISVLRFP